MWYLFFTSLSAIFFFIFDKYKSKILLAFPLFIFFIISAMQYDVGTDYNNYIDTYYYGVDLNRFYNSNELIFYYLFEFIRYYKLGPQSIFIISSFIMTMCFWYICIILKNNDIKIFVFFVLFMTCTGIYQNQLNGLRNFVAIYFFIISLILMFDRKLFLVVMFLILGLLAHSSFVIVIPFLILYVLYMRVDVKYYYLFFIFSGMIYFFIIPLFVEQVVDLLFPQYLYHLSNDAYTFSELLTKFVLLPIYILSINIYMKNNNNEKSFLGFMMFVFICTYWIILLPLKIGLASRLIQYFSFFNVFPIYFLLITLKNRTLYGLVVMMVIIPFIAKVTVLSKNEYDYKSIIFNYNQYSKYE